MHRCSLLTCLFVGALSLQLAWSQGNFWLPTGGPLGNQDVRILTSNSQGHLYAGTWTHGEVYKSTNNGDSWTACSPLPNPNPVLGLCIDAHDHIFASIWQRGIARSTDGGVSWQMKNSGLTNFTVRRSLVDNQGNVWLASEAGVFRSTDDGENWELMTMAYTGGLYQDSTGAIVSGDSYNLIRSTDGGRTWSRKSMNTCIICGIHSDGSYYGWNTSSQIFRSTDFGTTWNDLHPPDSWSGPVTDMVFTPQGDAFIARSGGAAGVLHTTDNGVDWHLESSGLTTTTLGPLYRAPNGILFLGTGGAGVFRSAQPSMPQAITVSLPTAIAAAGGVVEMPVTVTSLWGWRILAYDFTLNFNSPDSILSVDAMPVTAGTLSGQNGWSVLVNTANPNEVHVAAYGATPLSGGGTLVKLKLRISPSAQAGDSTSLNIAQLLFNTGNPDAMLKKGSLIIRERVCGDADENGEVQAYDAALTLREALGPMSPPPAPLTSMGRLNADVSMDGKVQAYDAALILRHVVGLSMPESTVTCFGGGVTRTPPALVLSGTVNYAQYSGGQWTVQLSLAGVPAAMQVLSCSFELTAPASWDDVTSLTLPQLAQGYLATVNQLENGRFRVGIINPNGVDVAGIPLTLSAKYASSINTITVSDLYLNDAPNASAISINNIFTSITEPQKPAQPRSFELIGAYPNPFNPTTRIVFKTPESTEVTLEMYNAQGVRVKALLHERVSAGQHEVSWNGTNSLGQIVATGEYFCVMRAGSSMKSMRVLLIK